MAYANDMSFEDIFVEQLKNLFQEGDIVLVYRVRATPEMC